MSDSASCESPAADGRNVREMSAGRRRILETWSREELLTWDARRQLAAADREDSMPTDNLPVARPIAPLPRVNPNVNPAAGIRGAAGRAHARTEAALALGYGDVLGAEVKRAQEQVEQARTDLELAVDRAHTELVTATGHAERTRLRGALRARMSFLELLFRTPGIPAAVALDEGSRVERPSPLEFDDCFIGAARPAALTTDRDHQTCAVCRQVKSHPVLYECGHSHCYACIRLWLEQRWTCPECQGTIHSPPIRHRGEEKGIEVDFPARVDGTAVTYSWDGLTFPLKF
ncbi:hypothetical protein B0H13DRAFT_2381836 [Mycena leptocephala]|nr:hypothetical protein B0H13DRAFT_2381836 [Mycena leptocephala]